MDDARVAAIEDAAALERLWESTLRYTVARGRSEREVQRRLRDRQATDDQRARIMQRLSANGLADENDNARQRVERLAMKGWATRRIESEMLGVGFPRDTVRIAVGEVLPADHDDQLLDALAAHPILMERPVVQTPLGVRVCRPADRLQEILPI
jgi:SOS response regulatory protein OraA/RecX